MVVVAVAVGGDCEDGVVVVMVVVAFGVVETSSGLLWLRYESTRWRECRHCV